ncbi:aspartyl-phosphate phosphatase Spo0E family protein [Brevibacillus daliensis]|uniref:aspartyl-phosphate phosphatase Spo0E family protein n=1 Tax=Brevibacillus daliensis TaxID=2892995 RepID=UPI001E4067C9|nr:aspartyl-phosphate phosphatase Spo0E family protein [Brevibacillus daliensis]
MEEVILHSKIEHLRADMERTYKEKGNFVDSRVVALSQKLDTYILQSQLLLKQKKTGVCL